MRRPRHLCGTQNGFINRNTLSTAAGPHECLNIVGNTLLLFVYCKHRNKLRVPADVSMSFKVERTGRILSPVIAHLYFPYTN